MTQRAGPAPVPDGTVRVPGTLSVHGRMLPWLPTDEPEDFLRLAAELPGDSSEQPTVDLRATASERVRQFLSDLAAPTHAAKLESFDADPSAPLDDGLDSGQRDAVARAIATPDLFLIRGLPGSGKSRVIREMLRQCLRRGERVLFLAPTSAALDVVLAELRDVPEMVPLRCLGREERPDQLGEVSGSLTWAEVEAGLVDRAVAHFRQQAEQVAREGQNRERHEDAWEKLLGFATQQGEARDEAASFVRQREAVPALVRAQSESETELAAGLREALKDLRERSDQLAARRAELTQLRAESESLRTDLIKKIEQLKSLAEVQQSGNWFSPGYWFAKFGGDPTAEIEQVQKQSEEAAAGITMAEAELAKLDTEEQQLEQEREVRREQYLADQIQSRQEDCERRREEFEDQICRLEARAEAIYDELRAHHIEPPTALGPDAIHEARQRNLSTRQELREAAAQIQQWADFLAEHPDEVRQIYRRHINLVAGPLSCPVNDPYFAAEGRSLQFDLLIIDDADLLSETEFLQVARLARRWVLVGNEWPADCQRSLNSTTGRARSAAGGQSDFLGRLWELTHGETWGTEQGRLCCRLARLTPEHRRSLDEEAVADSPDTVLRIVPPDDDGDPLLAEVLFPPHTSIEKAKAFLYGELNEVVLEVPMAEPRWNNSGSRLECRYVSASAMPARPNRVRLGDGITELVTQRPQKQAEGPDRWKPAGWTTIGFDFDTRSGKWTRETAKQWLRERLASVNRRRSARLGKMYRPLPALARWTAELFGLTLEGWMSPPRGKDLPVEFISVPDTRSPGRGRSVPNGKGSSGPGGSSRDEGGAGLEIDLSDKKQRAELLPEWQTGLPPRGVVNPTEAEAILKLLKDRPELRDTEVGVIALEPAQAELLKLLAFQDSTFAEFGRLRIGVPEDFAQIGISVVLVSMTRSHVNRAVVYGSGPADATLALTRAIDRIILVGDFGTLKRRTHWTKPLDHLNAAQARAEAEWLGRLLNWIRDPSSPASQPSRGSGGRQGARRS